MLMLCRFEFKLQFIAWKVTLYEYGSVGSVLFILRPGRVRGQGLKIPQIYDSFSLYEQDGSGDHCGPWISCFKLAIVSQILLSAIAVKEY